MTRKIGKNNVVKALGDSLMERGLDWDTVHMLAELERDCVPSSSGRRARVDWWIMARDHGFDGVIGPEYTWKTSAMVAWYGQHWFEVDNVMDHYFEDFGVSPVIGDGDTGSQYIVKMIWFALEFAAGIVCEVLEVE